MGGTSCRRRRPTPCAVSRLRAGRVCGRTCRRWFFWCTWAGFYASCRIERCSRVSLRKGKCNRSNSFISKKARSIDILYRLSGDGEIVDIKMACGNDGESPISLSLSLSPPYSPSLPRFYLSFIRSDLSLVYDIFNHL